MDSEVATLASAAVPFIVASVQAYGQRVLDRIQDSVIDHASNTSVDVGRRILARLLAQDSQRQAIAADVAEIAANPINENAQTVLQSHIRAALEHDEDLRAEILK